MNNFFERLGKYMEYKGLNDNSLSNKAGIPNGLIRKARMRGSLSGKNMSKLINNCEDLSADWLFTGKGDMLKSFNETDYDKDYIIELQKKTIKTLEDKIKLLEQNKN